MVLKVYYSRNTYAVSYDLAGGSRSDDSLYPNTYIFGENKKLDTPQKEGYDFYGWYRESSYDTKVVEITEKTNGNLTLYAKWIPAGTIMINEDMYLSFDRNMNGTFNIVGDTKYNAVNVLYKIVETESEAKQLAENKAEMGFVSWGLDSVSGVWSRTEDFTSRKGKYIVFYFIRYSESGGFKSDYAYGKINNESDGTVTEPETTEQTTTSEITSPETTTQPTPAIRVNPNVKVEGYQISSVSEGSRVIGSVEPIIEGKKVSKWGFLYAIIENGSQTYSVDDDEMYVGVKSPYVASMESTNVGTLSVTMGASKTATYFARTTLFSTKNAREFQAKYKVRAYALMEDGTYYYSDVSSYRVVDIAKVLYEKTLMNNLSGHKYLYQNILKVVDADYKEVDYDWSGTIVKTLP